jgi:7-cyano-7-deazaguanine synthase
MCAIVGAVVRANTLNEVDEINRILSVIWTKSRERGRDGAGWRVKTRDRTTETVEPGLGSVQVRAPALSGVTQGATIIGNLRAEPTTEYVDQKRKEDQQPYTAGKWSIAHNGTIANDKELRTHAVDTSIDSAAICEHLSNLSVLSSEDNFGVFKRMLSHIKGSYAILSIHADEPGSVYVGANYRPVWYAKTKYGTFFASARHYFPKELVPQMLTPYSAACFNVSFAEQVVSVRAFKGGRPKALVVCSGGLDSVVAATYAQRALDMDVELIHFQYGSRAEGPEVVAVKAVAEALGVPVTLFPLPVYRKEDSPLLDSDATVAGGEAGAEFAHEWVPARNLLLLSVATAFAEARGIEILVLGNNLEEAGAYPDNEPEFIARFNDMLPFAVGDGKRMSVIMPVGNMMKHEIVALGHQYDAPMDLTWSCYRAGTKHCGTCGPCYMRRKAFAINNLNEVIDYVSVD